MWRTWAFWDTLLLLIWSLLGALFILALISFALPASSSASSSLLFSPDYWVPLLSCLFIFLSVARFLATRSLIGPRRFPYYLIGGQLLASLILHFSSIPRPAGGLFPLFMQHFITGAPTMVALWIVHWLLRNVLIRRKARNGTHGDYIRALRVAHPTETPE